MHNCIIFEIILLYFIICFEVVRSEDFPVFQSQLEVIMYDNREIEFQLKDRGNLTVEIRPTSTSSLKGKLNKYNNLNDEVSLTNASVPLISSLYYYDKQSVETLRKFLEAKQHENISSVLKDLIHRYIREWDELIHDPRTEDFYTFADHPFPELETPFITPPKEIEHMFKLVRMNARVQTELATIVRLLEESQWKDAVEDIIKNEIKSEKYFNFEVMRLTAFEMMKLSEIHFPSPVGLFPENILQSIPIKDFITISLSTYDNHALREPLKWLKLGQQLFAQKHFTESSSEPKNSTESSDSVKESNTVLLSENITGSSDFAMRSNSKSESRKFTEDLPVEMARDLNFTYTYMEILRNHFSFKHDYALNESDYGSSFDNLFSKLLWVVDVEEQSTTDLSTDENHKENNELPTFKELCNGSDFRKPSMIMKLSCRYDHLGAPWYFLMPIKVEVLLEEPQIIFFHEVLSDSKMKLLLQLSLPLQTESGVHDPIENINVRIDNVRSSFVTPLTDFIDRRLQEITLISQYLSGLETTKNQDSEAIQINSYHAGGHYIPHMDSFRRAKYPPGATREEKERIYYEQYPNGDRVATILYYLNDVEEGGRTAFTNLGISVLPEKGGAVLWFSLFPSGKEDGRLIHAGCPVLKGVKTVVNKWIRYNSQLFRRPCLLERKNRLEFIED